MNQISGLSALRCVRASLVAWMLAMLVGAGCSFQSNAERGAVVGGVTGAGAGAAIGSQSGHAGSGATIGGITGAIAGGAVGDEIDREKQGPPTPQQQILREQDQERERQEKEIQDIRRQQFYNERMREY